MAAIASYTYHLDSRYRTSGSLNAPVFELPRPIVLSDPRNFFEVKVLSVEIPHTLFNVNSTNNACACQIENFNGTRTTIIDTTLLIPSGNYNITALLLALANATYGALFLDPLLVVIPVLDFTYSPVSGKVTLEMSTTGTEYETTIYFYKTVPSGARGLWSMMGIDPDYGTRFVLTCQPATLPVGMIPSSPIGETGVWNVNLSTSTSLLMRSKQLHQHTDAQERLVSGEWRQSDILLRIPIAVQRGLWIYYDNDTYTASLQQSEVASIDLYLTSNSLEAVDLNGIGWRTSITITERRSHLNCVEDSRLAFTESRRTEDVEAMKNTRVELSETLERQLKRARISTQLGVNF